MQSELAHQLRRKAEGNGEKWSRGEVVEGDRTTEELVQEMLRDAEKAEAKM